MGSVALKYESMRSYQLSATKYIEMQELAFIFMILAKLCCWEIKSTTTHCSALTPTLKRKAAAIKWLTLSIATNIRLHALKSAFSEINVRSRRLPEVIIGNHGSTVRRADSQKRKTWGFVWFVLKSATRVIKFLRIVTSPGFSAIACA